MIRSLSAMQILRRFSQVQQNFLFFQSYQQSHPEPMYVAIEEGYFKDAGIDLDLVTGFGADKVMTAVLSGEADIGFIFAQTTVRAHIQKSWMRW